MKKKLLAIFSALALSIGVSAFAACGGGENSVSNSLSTPSSDSVSSEQQQTLAAPVITLNADKTVSWTAVEGATGYVVYVNGTAQTEQTATTFAAQTTAGDYVIKVKATATDIESEFSEEVSYSLYTVTLPNDAGYTVTGESLVYSGDTYSFTVTLDGAYSQSTPLVEANGDRLTAVEGVYTVENVGADLEISVSNLELNTYSVTLPETAVGVEISGKSSVKHGESTFIIVTLADEYDRSQITVKANDETLTATDGVYKVENVTEDVTFTVEGVVLNAYNVTLPTGTGYTANGATTVAHGDNYTFTLTVAEGYEAVEAVVKCGETVLTAVEGVYTVENVTDDISITVEGVTLKKATYVIRKHYDDLAQPVETTARAEIGADVVYTVEDLSERFYVIDEERSQFTGKAADDLVLNVYYTSTVDLSDPSTWLADARSTITYADGVYTFTHDNSDSKWHDVYVSKKVVNAWLERNVQVVQMTFGAAGKKFSAAGGATGLNAIAIDLALANDTDSAAIISFEENTNAANDNFTVALTVVDEFDETDVSTWLYFNRIGQYATFENGGWTLTVPSDMIVGSNNYSLKYTQAAYEYLTSVGADVSYEIMLADGSAHFAGTDFNTNSDGWFNDKPLAQTMSFYIGSSSISFKLKASIYNSNDMATWLSLGVGTMSNAGASSATVTASGWNNLVISKKKVNEWLDAGATRILVSVSGANVSGTTSSMPNSSTHPYASTTWSSTANSNYFMGWINISETDRNTDVVAAVYTNTAVTYNLAVQGLGGNGMAVAVGKGFTTYDSETGVYTVNSLMSGYNGMLIAAESLKKLYSDGYTQAKITVRVLEGNLDSANSGATIITGALGMTKTVELSADVTDLLLLQFYYSGTVGYTVTIEGVSA
ncbi:MAG: hypothetical protein IJX87_03175 [Clostridia bacterium]|nr:hypothetical protein [Clostridia bacterium]